MSKIYEEIENSEEFKNSIKENIINVKEIKNEISERLLNTATGVKIVSFLLAIMASYNLLLKNGSFISIVVLFVVIFGSGIIIAMLLRGISEIIDILQCIKDKI